MRATNTANRPTANLGYGLQAIALASDSLMRVISVDYWAAFRDVTR
jgi:hypothetical protein